MGVSYKDPRDATAHPLKEARQPAILGICQPLLDIVAEVTHGTLEKYDLARGDMILAETKHMPLYAELKATPNVKYTAGGATQNTIRVAQWMLQEPDMTAFIGCVGQDEYATILEKVCVEDGVKAMYMVDKSAATGKCAVPIVNKERSLVTDLNASKNYRADHLKEPTQWKVLENAKIVYSSGFFITSSPESIELSSKETAKLGGVYCLNLAAPFLMEVSDFRAVIDRTLPLCDYLFGNETEALAYGKAVGWDTTDVEFIATRLSLVPMESGKPPRTVVITQGHRETIVAIKGVVSKHPIIQISEDSIVDTNGAGDAYVGGFLAALLKGRNIESCCKVGAYTASVVIQHYGCTYPAKPKVTLDTLCG